ncbi:GGDEF domain-containing protein [Shewanella maritima]|nr:GGDEF domain-containing protein [Shewanella maritima]
MKIAPQASTRFAIANIAMMTGFILYTQRSNEISYFAWFVADMVMLLGFMLVRWGGQSLFKQSSTITNDCLLLLATALLMLLVPPQTTYAAYMVLLMSLVAAYIFAMVTRDNYHALNRGVNLHYSVVLSVPFALASILFLARGLGYLLWPDDMLLLAEQNSLDQPVLMWTYIVMLLTVNIVLLGNAVARLVYKIRQLANRDQLTGLWNRHALLTKLADVDAHWRRHQHVYSVLVIDLDHFKHINDQYGHQIGDEALKHFSTLLTNSLRKVDFICRYGGEEFLVILPSTPTQQAMLVADKLLTIINRAPFKTANTNLYLTASIGVATCRNDLNYDQTLNAADSAMFEAKQNGRNTIRCAA